MNHLGLHMHALTFGNGFGKVYMCRAQNKCSVRIAASGCNARPVFTEAEVRAGNL